MTIRIAIADDHPVILAGVMEALQAEPTIEIVGSAPDSTALLSLLGTTSVDVVVTDYAMPGGRYGDGATLINLLQRRFPHVPVAVLTGTEGPQILQNIGKSGAQCIVSKIDPPEDIVRAIHAAYAGQAFYSPTIRERLDDLQSGDDTRLTRRESEVLRMFAEGTSLLEIAARLQRSRQTVSTQKRSAMRKLNLKSDVEIYHYALANGWVSRSQAARDTGSREGGAA
ncbi:DNA-binding response regulator [Stenotrophomonas maltophilia]|uniref:response regulator transcription factor n=1 Tax=Stenotrophomonas maltophilia TaxID=40324 RepID=UPI0010AB1CC2|nr:response regulator transcription factor [Stenotrophomonas maltophilia]TIE21829.1 DNA-binding response regulator [Stenotrophomonas maltophilia]TIE65823.1 DNA-binding response regulator [Stenotrophomonas maltophilia]